MLRNDHEMKISIVLSTVTTACYGLSQERLHTTTNRSLIRGREPCHALAEKRKIYKHYVVLLAGVPGDVSQNFDKRKEAFLCQWRIIKFTMSTHYNDCKANES